MRPLQANLIITTTHLDQAAVTGEVGGEPAIHGHISAQSIMGSYTTAAERGEEVIR